jgi:hypothetical protein
MYFNTKSYLKSNRTTLSNILFNTLHRDEGDIEFEIKETLFN